MIVVFVELWPGGDESKKQLLGTMQISNDGTGSIDSGNYRGFLDAEYTGAEPRQGSVMCFSRKRQSVWSLVGAFLKLWGHTSHSPKQMSK